MFPYFEAIKPIKVANWKYYFRVWVAWNILSAATFPCDTPSIQSYAGYPTLLALTRQFSHHSFTLYVPALVTFGCSNTLELSEKKKCVRCRVTSRLGSPPLLTFSSCTTINNNRNNYRTSDRWWYYTIIVNSIHFFSFWLPYHIKKVANHCNST